MSFRDSIIRTAQIINRHTPWLDGLKSKLGLVRLFEKGLVKQLDKDEIRRLRESIRENIITLQVEKLRAAGATEINFYILLVQSMGDIVAAEPIVRYLKSLSPGCKVHWIINRGFTPLIEYNPNIDEIIPVSNLSEGENIAQSKAEEHGNVIINCHFNGTSCGKNIYRNDNNPQVNIYNYYYIGSLLTNFCFAAGLPALDDDPIFHLDKNVPAQDFGDYVVFHCRSNGVDRNWTDEKWNGLANALTTKGIRVVEIGTERVLDPANNELIIDYTGRKSLQSVAAIVKNAKLLIGIDSVFAHVANGLRTPAVVIIGKFMNFETYFSYSGQFCRSDSFKIASAPLGKPAAEVEIKDVLNAATSILTDLVR